MRVAIIHYWLVTWRGGEHVLKALTELYPEADIYTHVVDPKIAETYFPNRQIFTTFISRLPFSSKLYQRYLPLMPLALEQLNLSDYDLVISSESGPSKGVIVPPATTHVCYCHSPMRYVWDHYHEYRREIGFITRTLSIPLLHYIRHWDQLSAQRVDQYAANSQFVANRIAKYYRRTAQVIHPPVAINEFDNSRPEEDFYLWVGQLVSYKRPDIAIHAFNELKKPLIMIGEGPLLPKLRKIANPNIILLGRQSFPVIRDYYSRCRAVIFPGIEDFGIVPVEAMASGKPVVAYNYGGARETILNGTTGLLFDKQTPQALVSAVLKSEREYAFDRSVIRAHAERFSPGIFRNKFEKFVRDSLVMAANN